MLYSWKYWWSLNLAVLPQMAFLTLLADFNLAVERHIAKQPNLIPHQISGYTICNSRIQDIALMEISVA